MKELIERIEAAVPSQQHDLLDEAWELLCAERDELPQSSMWRTGDFASFIENSAFIDAATMLIPADAFYRSGHDGEGPEPSLFFCEAIIANPLIKRARTVAETEALARAATALKLWSRL